MIIVKSINFFLNTITIVIDLNKKIGRAEHFFFRFLDLISNTPLKHALHNFDVCYCASLKMCVLFKIQKTSFLLINTILFFLEFFTMLLIGIGNRISKLCLCN